MFYPQILLHSDILALRGNVFLTQAFFHARTYGRLNTDVFKRARFYTKVVVHRILLHRDAFTQRWLRTQRNTISHTHTHTHTCSELSLRTLLWNASHAQKQSSYTWHGMDKVWKMEADPSPFKKIQIATTAQRNVERLEKDTPVLGLVGCHGRKWKNCSRCADWRPNLHHQIKWLSSLVAVPSDLPVPPAWRKYRENTEGASCMKKLQWTNRWARDNMSMHFCPANAAPACRRQVLFGFVMQWGEIGVQLWRIANPCHALAVETGAKYSTAKVSNYW